MNTKLNIPESYPHRERLEVVLDIIISIMKIDCIYFNSFNNAPDTYLLTIIITEHLESSYEDERLIRRIFKDGTFIEFQIYTPTKIEQSLERGKIFFLRLFTGTHIIYRNKESKYISGVNPEIILSESLDKFDLKYRWTLSRLAELSDIALYALENKYLQLSASMLYQVLSILYSLSEELYIGVEKPGYTLMERTEYLRKFNPELFAILNPKNKHHIHLARKISNAYRNFHAVEVKFSHKEIDELYLKVYALDQETQLIYNDILSQLALQIRKQN